MQFIHIEMRGECNMHTPFQRLGVKKKCKITFFFFNITKVKVYFSIFFLEILLKLISLVSFCYFHMVTRIFKISHVVALQFTSYPCWMCSSKQLNINALIFSLQSQLYFRGPEDSYTPHLGP